MLTIATLKLWVQVTLPIKKKKRKCDTLNLLQKDPNCPSFVDKLAYPQNSLLFVIIELMTMLMETIFCQGRLAFQALFSRDVLPQSFSPPHDLRNKVCIPENATEEGKQNSSKNDGVDMLELELSSKTWAMNLDHHARSGKDELLSNNMEKPSMDGLVGHSKLKASRTGFKPYKRCSVEVNESRVLNSGSQSEEKDAKRIRLQGEASA